MQIVRDDVGPHPVKRRQVVECLQERLIRGNVLQVTDVVTRHDVVTARDRNRRLQLRANREHGTSRGERQPHRLRCEAA